ncbi:MAG: acetoacetyl-CoA reductase [Candidatus Thiocaldithrix dubininis]|uniref:Acetoacetyl-CoA reductase n=1 Tax=Candidatus Thiocaldithrix dubininis TaxID=3080823 RepID=A0AA95HB69_9GAMM|nr:MAG: acetoacetyl-CoA reductase [Candidatus Thiocaldithrix dubininis]
MSKVALVTGGTGGIGNAICRKLAKDGYKVVTTYFEPEEKAKEWQAKQDYEVSIYPCDVSKYDECVSLKEAVEKDYGQVDVLVNCAGITRDAVFKKMTLDQWSAVMKTNLDSLFNVTHQFLSSMADRGYGRVINISSVNGQKGQFGQANYSAAKAGVHGFTMAIAQEVARKGVTVNTLSPGYIGTDMVMAIAEDVRNKIIAQIPVGRLGKPEEMAAIVAFLASDDAAFITGANISANGGQFIH